MNVFVSVQLTKAAARRQSWALGRPRRIQFGALLCESQQPLDLGRAASRAPHTAVNYFFCQARTNGRQILLLNASTAWFNVRTDNEKGSI